MLGAVYMSSTRSIFRPLLIDGMVVGMDPKEMDHSSGVDSEGYFGETLIHAGLTTENT